MLETSKSLCVTRHRSAPAAFRTGPGSSSDQQARVSPKAKLTYHMCVVFAFLACVTDPRACACSACWSDFSKVLCNSTPITEPSAHVFGSIPINELPNRDCTVCIASNSRRFGLRSMRWRLPTHRPAWLQRALVLFLSIGLLITFGTFFRDYVEGALPRHFVTSKSDSGKRHSKKTSACWTSVQHAPSYTVEPNPRHSPMAADANPLEAIDVYTACKWGGITCMVVAGPVTGECASLCLGVRTCMHTRCHHATCLHRIGVIACDTHARSLSNDMCASFLAMCA